MAIAPDQFVIRPESFRDQAEIRRVVAAAFGRDVEADLVDRIRESPEYVSETALVAELDGEIVGHVMISSALIRSRQGDRPIVMLSPLAVAPEHQKHGLGGALVRAATSIADQRGEPLVVLEGSPDYYSRFGFEPASGYGITMPLPDWAPTEAAQAIRLASYDPDDRSLRGAVVYPEAFAGVE